MHIAPHMSAKTFQVRPSPQLRARVEEEATTRGITVSELIREILTQHLMPETDS